MHMGAWDTYEHRITIRGSSKRGNALRREIHALNAKEKDSLSFHTVDIDGDVRDVMIINSDNLEEKTIISKPQEDLYEGMLVDWMDNFWLITERDANSEVYTKAKMIQCNYLLKWVSDDDVIHEQWCVIEDGTKYLNGILEDRNFIITRGDSRIAMTIARNEYTKKFGRKNRFIIDEPDSDFKIAYELSKPLKVGHTYNDKGIYKFVLQEVQTTKDDNIELSIADYYKHFPSETSMTQVDDMEMPTGSNGKQGWL